MGIITLTNELGFPVYDQSSSRDKILGAKFSKSSVLV
jgi:hypothetical protein